MKSQKEAVYEAVIDATNLQGYNQQAINYRNLVDNDPSLKKDIYRRVKDMFDAGETGFKSANAITNNPKSLDPYIRGLVNNWLRKDVRLNGGQLYTAKPQQEVQEVQQVQACECGAVHTSNPTFHSDWCPAG